MEIRERGKRTARRLRRRNLHRKRHTLLLHRVEQQVMEMALPADGRDRFLQCRTRIDESRSIFPKPVIGIREIAAVPRLQPLLCKMPLHQREIALVLGADAPRRIADMADRERDRLMRDRRHPALLPQRLMHPPRVEQTSPHAQEADVRRTPQFPAVRILVDVDNRQQHRIHMGHRHIHHRQIAAHLRRIEKGLIRIRNRRPVARRDGKRGIAGGGEIVSPREIRHPRPCRLRQFP